MILNVDNSRTALAIPALFRLAFRPLFLGGSLFSAIALGWWVYFWVNPVNWIPYGGHIWWHGHEMIFGFGTAIVAGFLLTAVSNWTGVIGLRGKPLALLFLTWLLGRILVAFPMGLPSWTIAMIDILYLLLVGVAMAYPIVKVKQWQNLMFVPILVTFAGLNAVSHWSVISNQYQLSIQALHATIMLFVLLIAVLGGRVIPSFTSNTMDRPRVVPVKWLEIIAIGSILLMIIIAILGFDTVPSNLLAIISSIAAIANFIRFARWGIQHSYSVPLLWSLHLSYLFIPLGFMMLGLHGIGLMENTSAAIHSFTVGAIGGMILAMISRVTLGHTGRPLIIQPLVVFAFISIFFAAIIRVVVPAWFPDYYKLAIILSGVLWVMAFAAYVYFYTPMLLKARVDGQPG